MRSPNIETIACVPLDSLFDAVCREKSEGVLELKGTTVVAVAKIIIWCHTHQSVATAKGETTLTQLPSPMLPVTNMLTSRPCVA